MASGVRKEFRDLRHSNYVFYKTLGDPRSNGYRPELYNNVMNSFMGESTSNMMSTSDRFSAANVVDYLRTMANQEEDKERELLSQFYWDEEVNIDDLYTEGDIVRYINYLMQGEALFNFTIERILNWKSKNALGEFLVTGAGKNMGLDELTEKLEENKLKVSGELIQSIQEGLNSLLQEATKEAVMKEINGRTLSVEEQGKILEDITHCSPKFQQNVMNHIKMWYDSMINKAVFQTLDRVFKRSVFKGDRKKEGSKEDKQLIQELASYINLGRNGAGSGIGGQLLRGIKEVYGLEGPVYDDIMYLLQSSLNESEEEEGYNIEKLKSLIGEQIAHKLYLRKVIQMQNMGKSMSQAEFEKFAFDAAQKNVMDMIAGLKSVPTGSSLRGDNVVDIEGNIVFRTSSISTQGQGMNHTKINTVYTFGTDSNIIEKAITEGFETAKQKRRNGEGVESTLSSRSVRGLNTAAWREIQVHWNQLKKKTGFIVYSNSKVSSAANSNDGWGGFQVENNITLMHLQDAFRGAMMKEKSDFLISAIENSMEGAIYEGHSEELVRGIAQNIAYFLFDDFKTIGDDLYENLESGHHGLNAIHLMNLNGVYIPLSILLNRLADAVSTVDEKDLQQVLNVNINKGAAASIAYPEGPWTQEQWNEQRNIALTSMTVKVKIMKGFTQFIMDMYGNGI